MMKICNTNKIVSTSIQAVAGAGLIMLTTALPVSADENLLLHGKSVGDWTAGWWQWQEANFPNFEFGGDVDPDTGEVSPTADCSMGQSGPVWYLGGTGGGAAVRECEEPIKGHKHLMFPLVNANMFNPDDFCEAATGELDCTVEQKREILDGIFSEAPAGIFNSAACVLQAEVDGEPAVFSAPIVRTQSPPFSYAEDPETVADGLWVVLSPLSSGEHTVHFTGGICDIDSGEVIFSVEVTYTLSVK